MSSDEVKQKLLDLARLRNRVRELEEELDLSAGLKEPDGDQMTFPEEWAFRLVAQHATDLISVHAANGDYLYASPNSQDFFGWSPEELLGRNAYNLFHPDDLERIADNHAGHDGHGERAVRYRLRRLDGSYLWVSTRSRSRQTTRGVEQIVCITRNIEVELLAEESREALFEQLRMRSLSELSSAISHEINNPLSYALSELSYLRHAASTVEDGDEIFEAVEHALSRIKVTMRELRLLASVSQPKIESVACDQVVKRILNILEPGHCDVQINLHPTRVLGDRGRIYQLAFELLSTHMRALDTGDALSISCRPQDDEGHLEIIGGMSPPPENLRIDLLEVMREGRTNGAAPLAFARRLATEQQGMLQFETGKLGLRSKLVLPAA